VLTDPKHRLARRAEQLVGSTAAFGTDYDLMQRLLTVNRAASASARCRSPIGTLVTLAIYLAIGRGCTYRAASGQAAASRIFHSSAAFARALATCAERHRIASIDSPSSLAPSSPTSPAPARPRPRTHYCACRASPWPPSGDPGAARWVFVLRPVLRLAFKIAGSPSSSLLGVFLLGLVARVRANRPTWRRWS
jgi:hypothetical protein